MFLSKQNAQKRRSVMMMRRRRRKDCVVNFVADVVALAAAADELMMGRYCKLCASRSTESVECKLYFFVRQKRHRKTDQHTHVQKIADFITFLVFFFCVKTKPKTKANQRNQKTDFHSIFLRNSNVICNDNSSNHT